MSEPKSKAWMQNLAMIHVVVVLWFSKVYVYCTLHPRNTIIPHEGYNPYTILYYDATTQTLRSVSPTTSTVLYYVAGVYFHTP